MEFFKKYFIRQGKLATFLSSNAYGVYVLQTPVLVGISAIFLGLSLTQLLKFVVLAPIALTACFIVAGIVKQVPGIKRIL